jgi:hypothetical protein
VAGGNKQRDCISKEDASSPTVATELALLSCVVDAKEERDVAIVNVPSTFMQARVGDEKHVAFIKTQGVLVDVLVEIASETCKSCVGTLVH